MKKLIDFVKYRFYFLLYLLKNKILQTNPLKLKKKKRRNSRKQKGVKIEFCRQMEKVMLKQV